LKCASIILAVIAYTNSSERPATSNYQAKNRMRAKTCFIEWDYWHSSENRTICTFGNDTTTISTSV